MVITRRALFGLGLGLGLLAADALPAAAAEPVKVVASFSILGDLVRQVGGERVAVTTLVGPDGDAHVFQPAPADALAVAGAALVVVNGLGFEGWLDRLVEAAGYRGPVVVAAAGVTPRAMAEAPDHEPEPEAAHAPGDAHDHDHDHDHPGHDHGDIDPHAWQSVANVKLYVAQIRDGLIAVDGAGAESFRANAASTLAELDALEAEIKAAVAAIPPERRKIVTSHDAFGYLPRPMAWPSWPRSGSTPRPSPPPPRWPR